MAFILNDRVKETSITTGTGTLNLAGAVQDFETFVAGIGTTNETYYCIVHPGTGEFEVGRGTVTDATPDTLSRAQVFSSSNSDNPVDFSAGTKDVFCTLPASKAVVEDANNDVTLPADLTVGANIDVSSGGAKIKLDGSYPVGINNVALGSLAGANLNSGAQSNTLIGVTAGNNIAGSDYNTAVGNQALRIGGGNNLRENTAVGYKALEASIGPGNTAVGYEAGSNISTGNNNTVIGASATPSSATVSNEITLGNSSVASFRIPGLQSSGSSGDVMNYDGTSLVLGKVSSTNLASSVSLQIIDSSGSVLKTIHGAGS